MPRKPYTPAGEALIKTLDALDPGDDVMLAVHAYLARSAPAPTVDAAALDVEQEREAAYSHGYGDGLAAATVDAAALANALHEVYCHRHAPMHSAVDHSAAAILAALRASAPGDEG